MARRKKPARTESQCRWIDDGEGNWQTDCGEMFILIEGTPSQNDMSFCCHCGKPLVEKEGER